MLATRSALPLGGIWCYSCETSRTGRESSSIDLPIEQENVMIKFGLIGASALTLALAAPVMARDIQHVRQPVRGVAANAYGYYGEPNLPVENALRWGYSQGYSHYPSGFGGLYGDGRYPDNVVSNPNHPFR